MNDKMVEAQRFGSEILQAIDQFLSPQPPSAFKTLAATVAAFNSADWGTYETYVDPGCVIYNVSDTAYLIGRDAVMKHFRSYRGAKFLLTNDISWRPPSWPLAVRGIALWSNKDHGHIDVPVRYDFQFHPVSFNLQSIWAQKSAPKDERA